MAEEQRNRPQWIMGMPYLRRWEARREARRKRRDASEGQQHSYYGLPAIHAAHWRWLIILYFFLGGISGASYVIAALVDLFGRREDRAVARIGRYVSLAALLPCPILLILDLGRPERFLYMLRVVKLRSPMSVGSWGLLVFGGLCGLSAMKQAARDGLLGRLVPVARVVAWVPARALYGVGSVFGFFIAGYTGILLSITAVPLWAKNYMLLAPLFLASAMSTATSAITLMLTLMRDTRHDTLRRLERLDSISLAAELALIAAIFVRSGAVIRRPLEQGRIARVGQVGLLGGIVLPLLLQGASAWGTRRPSFTLSRVASVLVLTGGFILRYVLVMGGHQSAADPEATFDFARRSE